jgi:hypothetical protein|nr:MAG TPA: hypothetical protein [Caudoviricetes sp.]
MKGITNAQKDVSDLATKDELALKADQSVLDAKANQSDLMALQTIVAGKQDKLTAGTNITISGNTISASGGTITAGEGISVSGTKVSLKSIGSSKSAGSGTSVPVVSIDSYGRVTDLGSTTIYPPTTAGEAGQVWMSDGSGQGHWANPGALKSIAIDIKNAQGYITLPVDETHSRTAATYFPNEDSAKTIGSIQTIISGGVSLKGYPSQKTTIISNTSFTVHPIAGDLSFWNENTKISISNDTGAPVSLTLTGYGLGNNTRGWTVSSSESSGLVTVKIFVPSNAKTLGDCTIITCNGFGYGQGTEYPHMHRLYIKSISSAVIEG